MAASPQADQLTKVYIRQSTALRSRAVADVLRLWPALDPTDLAGSWPALERALQLLILSGRREAAALAGGYLVAFRALEGAPGSAAIISGANLSAEALATSLRVTGPVTIKRAVSLGLKAEQAGRTGLVSVSGAVSRLILNGGRDTIQRSIQADKQALGYARVASGSACSFCALIASRGPVYKSSKSAGSGHSYHDHCNCGVEPVYSRDAAWPDNSRKYEELWKTTTKGLSGAEARNAFRVALSHN